MLLGEGEKNSVKKKKVGEEPWIFGGECVNEGTNNARRIHVNRGGGAPTRKLESWVRGGVSINPMEDGREEEGGSFKLEKEKEGIPRFGTN